MGASRLVAAVHGSTPSQADCAYELAFARDLAGRCAPAELLALYRRFSEGDEHIDNLLRRACVRALARSCGDGLRIAPHVGLRHPETFEIGAGVFLGEQAILHGRHDGSCVIGDKVWIGPQAFLDARDLTIGDHVGWGPGARLLGSRHTGEPEGRPIIATDLLIAPTVIEPEADIGMNAVIMPGVRIGRGAMIGAGAVVTHDVPPFAKAAGVPARVIGYRKTVATGGLHDACPS